jgi:hypothetical protein
LHADIKGVGDSNISDECISGGGLVFQHISYALAFDCIIYGISVLT